MTSVNGGVMICECFAEALHWVVVAGETAALHETDDRHRALYADSLQREKVLVRRLAAKEQEMQDYVVCSGSFWSFYYRARLLWVFITLKYFLFF